MEFHHHEIPHPTKESALFHIFHHDQRTLLNGFTVKLEINGADNLTFFSGAVSCGSVNV